MNVRRTALGAWFTVIALLAVACGAGTDQNAAGADTAPAAPTTDHDQHDQPDPGEDLSTTEATLAAMAAMDPEVLARAHDHHRDDHDGHETARREGRNSVDPARIVIPAIDVDATIDRAGIDDDGQMQVPDFGDTAWFTPSVKPGRVGPSVITGHVDTEQGPDVFFRLKDLQTGDHIQVHGDDGTVVSFAVTAVEQHPKNDYPRKKVHAATDRPELRLITCGGIFDRTIGHYDDNIIVFARRLTARNDRAL